MVGPPPPVDRMTEMTENITFATPLAGGNYVHDLIPWPYSVKTKNK